MTKRMGRPKKYGVNTYRFSIVLPRHDLDYIARHAPATSWGEHTIHSRGTGVHNVIAKARVMDSLMQMMSCDSIEDAEKMLNQYIYESSGDR